MMPWEAAFRTKYDTFPNKTSNGSQNIADPKSMCMIHNCSIGNALLICLKHQSNNERHSTPSPLCLCLRGCKLNFTLPAAGCLGPPGSAERQLMTGWHISVSVRERARAAEQSVLTRLSIWQKITNNLTLTSTFSHLSGGDTFAQTLSCVCVRPWTHTRLWLLAGTEWLFFSFSEEHPEEWSE